MGQICFLETACGANSSSCKQCEPLIFLNEFNSETETFLCAANEIYHLICSVLPVISVSVIYEQSESVSLPFQTM